MRYFIHNLETDKLNIFTGGKSEWLALPEAQRQSIKSNCLWARSINGWVSRAKGANPYLRTILAEAGFEDRGTQGERLSFAEQVGAKQERAEQRAERFEDRAGTADKRSDSLYAGARTMADAIPFGQPILIGHYSEGRDRRFRERISRTFERAFEEGDKAKYYERRAATARATADGAQYSSPAYLGNRIKECKAEIGKLERYLAGKRFSTVQAERIGERCGDSAERTVSDAEKSRWTADLDEWLEKLEFYEHCLSTCPNVFTKESLTGKQAVKIRGGWFPIVKVNKTTVAVPNTCFPQAVDQARYALKYAFTEIQEAR
jgi:hypothetical protein